ncbi:MAG: MFS transporter, partial [Kitasatospora sp.]|nr:MFS transporter [Kitasatospora sp.]
GGRELLGRAYGSFVHAMHVTALTSAAIVLLAALVTAVFMPGRDAPERAKEIPERENAPT